MYVSLPGGTAQTPWEFETSEAEQWCNAIRRASDEAQQRHHRRRERRRARRATRSLPAAQKGGSDFPQQQEGTGGNKDPNSESSESDSDDELLERELGSATTGARPTSNSFAEFESHRVANGDPKLESESNDASASASSASPSATARFMQYMQSKVFRRSSSAARADRRRMRSGELNPEDDGEAEVTFHSPSQNDSPKPRNFDVNRIVKYVKHNIHFNRSSVTEKPLAVPAAEAKRTEAALPVVAAAEPDGLNVKRGTVLRTPSAQQPLALETSDHVSERYAFVVASDRVTTRARSYSNFSGAPRCLLDSARRRRTASANAAALAVASALAGLAGGAETSGDQSRERTDSGSSSPWECEIVEEETNGSGSVYESVNGSDSSISDSE